MNTSPRAPSSPLRRRSPSVHQMLSSLGRLLASRDLATIDAALEMLRALDDSALYEVLLDGASYDQRLVSIHKRFQPYSTYILHRLIAEAPIQSCRASSLREQIDSLEITGTPLHDQPLTLSSLSVLPRLVHLRLQYVRWLTKDGGALSALEQLTILNNTQELDLSWLERSPRLRALRLYAVRSWSGDLSCLSSLGQLATVELHSCAQLETLEGVNSALETISLRYCPTLRSLAPLCHLPSLRKVEIYGCILVPPAEVEALQRRGVAVSRW